MNYTRRSLESFEWKGGGWGVGGTSLDETWENASDQVEWCLALVLESYGKMSPATARKLLGSFITLKWVTLQGENA